MAGPPAARSAHCAVARRRSAASSRADWAAGRSSAGAGPRIWSRRHASPRSPRQGGASSVHVRVRSVRSVRRSMTTQTSPRRELPAERHRSPTGNQSRPNRKWGISKQQSRSMLSVASSLLLQQWRGHTVAAGCWWRCTRPPRYLRFRCRCWQCPRRNSQCSCLQILCWSLCLFLFPCSCCCWRRRMVLGFCLCLYLHGSCFCCCQYRCRCQQKKKKKRKKRKKYLRH
mmetsp:Transcript_45799/g.93740  ORF Transcript_45799/g.93740 Transcript_45799/m.93740 type:complete len:228 (-) Transcript_45799:33-716(-)